ncbi:alpha/beta hydrolase [Curtobacterium sp. MCBD17_040]|uniref:alpha/beta hydrolase n=1 Tax=Curtobacterium sp. MCBD17_040 TaxID=2175674 RepID=UPI000DA76AB3|nr:alpha/beta hydrolase [Curtobacterium sp. MCBD17_040]WIB64206.1 alpha/beta hydrolase [Curtobacterium sp. MCBD17_040]
MPSPVRQRRHARGVARVGDHRRLPALTTVVLALVLVLTGCVQGPTGDTNATVDAGPVIYPLSLRYPDIRTVSDVAYGEDRLQRLDVCLPAGHEAAAATATATAAPLPGGGVGAQAGQGTTDRPAVMMIHGGSWSHGDKATAAYHAVCEYFASQGFVVFDVDYRLAPTDPFPAGLDDVRRALDWVFRTTTLTRFRVDRERVGVFGGSAGGNLAAMLAVQDHASTAYANGDRIRAVAELSGPSDLTAASTGAGGVTPSFARKQLLYLGCTRYADCPAARRASPVDDVTAQTPPFFIGHSTHEFIPLWESQHLARALRRHGVPVTLVEVRGTAHSIAQLDRAMSERVVAYFRRRLG